MKNIRTTQEYAKETRVIIRELEEEVSNVTNNNLQLINELAVLKTQIQQIQIKLYSGGATN